MDYENSDGKNAVRLSSPRQTRCAADYGMVKELGIVNVLILVLTSLGLSFGFTAV